MARKGLPRKYAKMGFKKGWAAYKRTKRSPVRRTTTKRRSKPMARRSYKKYARRARTAGGSMKPIIDGAIAGAGGQLASGFLGNYSMPVVTLGVGYFRKNNTLKTLGAYELGQMLAGGFSGGNGGGGGFN